MTVRRLLAGKPGNVSVIPPHVRVQDVINQLEADDVSALVVSNNGANILGIISAGEIVRGLKTFGRDVVDRPLGDLMTRDVISCDIGEPMSRI
jgi:CBS domain-containing protein